MGHYYRFACTIGDFRKGRRLRYSFGGDASRYPCLAAPISARSTEECSIELRLFNATAFYGRCDILPLLRQIMKICNELRIGEDRLPIRRTRFPSASRESTKMHYHSGLLSARTRAYESVLCTRRPPGLQDPKQSHTTLPASRRDTYYYCYDIFHCSEQGIQGDRLGIRPRLGTRCSQPSLVGPAT
jgi:hypothetical protein